MELEVCDCKNLVKLPNMHKFKKLKTLNVSLCPLINSLQGLNELVLLRSFSITSCENFNQVFNVYKFTNLRQLKLDLNGPIQSFIGLNDLTSLEELKIGIDELHGGLDLSKLTMLKELDIAGWQGKGLSSLVSLVSATIDNCKGIRILPDLHMSSNLITLKLNKCEFEDMSSLSVLTRLENLEIKDCDKLEVLPDLQELATLVELVIAQCAWLKDVCGMSHLTNLETLKIKDCNKLKLLPDLRKLAKLEVLSIKRCVELRDVHGILGLQNLKRLRSNGDPYLHENLQPNFTQPMLSHNSLVYRNRLVDQQGGTTSLQLCELKCIGCPIEEFPDLAHFSNLVLLNIRDCKNLSKLTCIGPLNPKFKGLDIHGCLKLQALPDLTILEDLKWLDISNSGMESNAQFIEDIKACFPSIHLTIENDFD